MFMRHHRKTIPEHESDLMPLKEAFYAGWEAGYYQHQRLVLLCNLALMGVMLIVAGVFLHYID